MNNCLKQIHSMLKDKTDHVVELKKDFIINLYSFAQFKLRLKLEERRSVRLNTQAAILKLNFEKESDLSRTFRKEICFLLATFCFLTRETDAVTLKDNNTILLLLPDTDEAGVRTVAGKIMAVINKLHREHTIMKNLSPQKIKILYSLIPKKSTAELDSINSFCNVHKS